MWTWLVVAVGIAALLGAIAWAARWVEKQDRAKRKAYEYARSDEGIKDAAKRQAKFIKQVNEELSMQEKKRTD